MSIKNYDIKRDGAVVGRVCCDTTAFFVDEHVGAIWYFMALEPEVSAREFDEIIGELTAEESPTRDLSQITAKRAANDD